MKYFFVLGTVAFLLASYATQVHGDEISIAVPSYSAENYQRVTGEAYKDEQGSGVKFVGVSDLFARLGAFGQAAGPWKIVELTQSDLQRACDLGLVEESPEENLLSEVNPDNGSIEFLPGTQSKCGVGTGIYPMVFAYDERTIGSTSPETMSDFFDVDRFPGKRGLRQGVRFNLEMALIADGTPPEEVYDRLQTAEGLDAALSMMNKLEDHIIWWRYSNEPVDLLTNGQVTMTTGYANSFQTTSSDSVRTIWDGQVWSFDSLAIPKGTKEKNGAMSFLKWATGETHAKLMRESGLVIGTAFLRPGDGLQQCGSNTCPCAGTSACSKSCCNATSKNLFSERGLLYSPRFWLENQSRIDDSVLQRN